MPRIRPQRPNLFIVGFPRCGTTTMAAYLSRHPAVYFSDPKEPFFFASDLCHPSRVSDPGSYYALFAAARDQRYRAEGSTQYIYSATAAEEIKRASPDARIIIMLRSPIGLIEAHHRYNYLRGLEPIRILSDALKVEKDRKEGRRIPKGIPIPEALLYRERANCSGYIQNYVDIFGRNVIYLGLFDDLAYDSERIYKDVLRFLALDEDATFQATIHNRSDELSIRRSSHLYRLMVYRPPWLEAVRRALPSGARSWAWKAIDQLNCWGVQRKRPVGMDEATRLELAREFGPEIERLSGLVGRDLSHWLEPPASVRARLPADEPRRSDGSQFQEPAPR